MNLSSTIIPKSDQLNADDLISGPRTIRITNVLPGSAEQPVCITYEGDAGRPYKPSKSMRRVLVTIWGSDGAAYVGRSLTLYRDPEVTFGKDVVGGVKISHATDIAEPVIIALTVTRGRRKPFRVEPLAIVSTPTPLEGLPESWADWSNEERGEYMATQSLPKLQAWWATLAVAEKKALEGKLRNDWKPAAESKVRAMMVQGGRP